jgi:hypothetical protein
MLLSLGRILLRWIWLIRRLRPWILLLRRVRLLRRVLLRRIRLTRRLLRIGMCGVSTR